MALYWSRVYWEWWRFAGDGDRAEGWNGRWEGGMGYWCSLTHFCSYKHTTEGDDLLITFVFLSSLPA
jgi:hypothetical protein